MSQTWVRVAETKSEYRAGAATAVMRSVSSWSDKGQALVRRYAQAVVLLVAANLDAERSSKR